MSNFNGRNRPIWSRRALLRVFALLIFPVLQTIFGSQHLQQRGGTPMNMHWLRRRCSHLASPSERAVLCPDKGDIDAICRLGEELPERDRLVAAVHLGNAIQVKVPGESPAACNSRLNTFDVQREVVLPSNFNTRCLRNRPCHSSDWQHEGTPLRG